MGRTPVYNSMEEQGHGSDWRQADSEKDWKGPPGRKEENAILLPACPLPTTCHLLPLA